MSQPVSSDARRDLYEFEGYPVCKLIVAKEDCILGEHFHKLKDEVFLLLSGEAFLWIGGIYRQPMEIFAEYRIPARTIHTFKLTKGAILLGFCTKPYDPTDDYKVNASEVRIPAVSEVPSLGVPYEGLLSVHAKLAHGGPGSPNAAQLNESDEARLGY